MTPDFTVKRNDLGKVISGQLVDADGNGVDLSGSTSRKLIAKRFGDGSLKFNVTFDFINGGVTGEWQYALTATDVDTAGLFKLEWEVTRAGHVDTFPTDPAKPYMLLLVQEDLG